MHVKGKSGRIIAGFFLTGAFLGMTACSETAGGEKSTTIEDLQVDEAQVSGVDELYDGPYSSDFAEEISTYVGDEVVVSAKVGEVISEQAFMIAGGDVEALLIVSTDTFDVSPGALVKVTGTVRKAFTLADVKEDFGSEIDDELFVDREGEPYILASDIVLVAPDGN